MTFTTLINLIYKVPAGCGDSRLTSLVRMETEQELRSRLGLTRLEREGGLCHEVGLTSDGSSSSIFYMVRSSDSTVWHRLEVNEFWCHHQGARLR